MSIAKHVLMTVCAGTVLWLMMLVGGLVWAMLSHQADSSIRTHSGGLSTSKRDPRRTGS